MTDEELAKALTKFLIENGQNNLTEVEKELLKQAVDQSHNWQELLTVAMIAKLK